MASSMSRNRSSKVDAELTEQLSSPNAAKSAAAGWEARRSELASKSRSNIALTAAREGELERFST